MAGINAWSMASPIGIPSLPVVPSLSVKSAAALCAEKVVIDAMTSALKMCFVLMNSIPHQLNFMIASFIATLAKERDRCLE
jgi:hypothetical protein